MSTHQLSPADKLAKRRTHYRRRSAELAVLALTPVAERHQAVSSLVVKVLKVQWTTSDRKLMSSGALFELSHSRCCQVTDLPSAGLGNAFTRCASF